MNPKDSLKIAEYKAACIHPAVDEELLLTMFTHSEVESAVRLQLLYRGEFESLDGELRWTGECVIPGGGVKSPLIRDII